MSFEITTRVAGHDADRRVRSVTFIHTRAGHITEEAALDESIGLLWRNFSFFCKLYGPRVRSTLRPVPLYTMLQLRVSSLAVHQSTALN